MKNEVIRLDNISKKRNGITVLRNARLNLYSGEMLGVIGLNGSGKTELMKIIAGFASLNKGAFYIDNAKIERERGFKSGRAGVYYVGEDRSLIPGTSVQENISLAIKNPGFFYNRRKIRSKVKTLLKFVGLDIDPCKKIDGLPIEHRHLIHICRALICGTRILIIDGVTQVYSDAALLRLETVLKNLKDEMSIIYVNNRWDLVMDNVDRITILKDGRFIRTLKQGEYTKETVFKFLSDYDIFESQKKPVKNLGSEILQVKSFSNGPFYEDINFRLKAGEILGFAIYENNIRNAFAESLFGLRKDINGTIYVGGKKTKVGCANSAINHGIGLIPGSRPGNGIFNNLTVGQNAAFFLPRKVKSRLGLIKRGAEEHVADFLLKEVGMAKQLEEPILHLSNLDRIKLLIQKWMVVDLKVLIFINPTLDVDLLQRDQVHSMIYDIAKRGIGIILITPDLHELLDMSDRIILLKEGRVEDEFHLFEDYSFNGIKQEILNVFMSK